MGIPGLEQHYCAVPPLFDPAAGVTVIEPAGTGDGYWAGAPSATYDPASRRFYLYYRVRKPRPIRGGEIHIDASEDGLHFSTIWRATREDFGSDSIERSALIKTPAGRWRLYVSYVDPADSRWRTDMLEAPRIEDFDPGTRRKVFAPGDIGVEGVKDPFVICAGGLYYMFLSYSPTPAGADPDAMHGTADIYNTGLSKSSSALAVSGNGVDWEWRGDIFCPREQGWDSYASRLGCVIYRSPVWIGFYDGSASVAENYEEKTGLCVSHDLMHWERVSADGPALVSPVGSGSLRYIDAIVKNGEIWFYYEYARADGSHELRLNRVAA